MKKKLLSLSQIEKLVNISANLTISKFNLPSYGSGNEYHDCYIKVSKDRYLLYEFDPYKDKNNQHLEIETSDIEELLFEVFKSATREIAYKYELKNRIPNQDIRIIAFEKHIEILNSLPLEKKFVTILKEYYDNLLRLKQPLPLPNKW